VVAGSEPLHIPTGSSPTAAINRYECAMNDSSSRPLGPPTILSTVWQRAFAAARRHPGSRYQALREVLRIVIPYTWRRGAVHFVRRRFGLLSARDWLFARVSPAPSTNSTQLPAKDAAAGPTLLPHLPPEEVKAILNRPVTAEPVAKPDVVCLSIIDWSFRFQRPQQLMAQFAAHGHRVFYLNVSDFRSQHARPKFAAEPIQYQALKNLYEVKLAARYPRRV
jgi:hypothetical protein